MASPGALRLRPDSGGSAPRSKKTRARQGSAKREAATGEPLPNGGELPRPTRVGLVTTGVWWRFNGVQRHGVIWPKLGHAILANRDWVVPPIRQCPKSSLLISATFRSCSVRLGLKNRSGFPSRSFLQSHSAVA